MRAANLYALGAIVLWGCLAYLGVALAAVPPFLLVGCALTLAGAVSFPWWRQSKVRAASVALGVYGLFGFHFFLFIALRTAPAVAANLVNYLWPVLMVLLAPLVTRSQSWTVRHILAVTLGFTGAALAVVGSLGASERSGPASHALVGYGCAFGSAVIWATYSLLRQRRTRKDADSSGPSGTSSAVIGMFCLCSGVLSLACHWLLEEPYRFSSGELPLLVILAAGPMGGAFFLWDIALRRGDARTVGALAFLAPLLSTLLLIATGHGHATVFTAAAVLLIIAGAALGSARSPTA